jgi:hypothetical protein
MINLSELSFSIETNIDSYKRANDTLNNGFIVDLFHLFLI